MSRSVGKRIQIFQIVRDLLLFVAHRDRDIPVSVRLGRRDDIGFVEMEFGGEGICFECPPDWATICWERLYQVGGGLDVEPDDPAAAQRVTLWISSEAARAAGTNALESRVAD